LVTTVNELTGRNPRNFPAVGHVFRQVDVAHASGAALG
jgi:hypothetical protein